MDSKDNFFRIMKVTAFFFLFSAVFFIASSSSAHPGNTAADGCHYCWTNCPSWGEVYGQRHCHNGGGYDSNYDPPERDYDEYRYDEPDYSSAPVDPEGQALGSSAPAEESKPNSNCYIATAAYGTPLANDIDVLRDFRDKSLITNSFGNMFVQTYYKYSPPVANILAHNEILKFIVREGEIKPLVNTLRLTEPLWDNK